MGTIYFVLVPGFRSFGSLYPGGHSQTSNFHYGRPKVKENAQVQPSSISFYHILAHCSTDGAKIPTFPGFANPLWEDPPKKHLESSFLIWLSFQLN